MQNIYQFRTENAKSTFRKCKLTRTMQNAIYAAQPFFLRYHASVASPHWIRMPIRASRT